MGSVSFSGNQQRPELFILMGSFMAISGDNIMIREDSTPVIIDFSTRRF